MKVNDAGVDQRMEKKMPFIPSELLVEISRSLDKKGLKNFRLASRRFNDCSKEHLITNVTVAARAGTLKTLSNIVNHPLYSKTVKKVTIDGSHFQTRLLEKDAYKERFREVMNFGGCPEQNDMIRDALNPGPRGLGLPSEQGWTQEDYTTWDIKRLHEECQARLLRASSISTRLDLIALLHDYASRFNPTLTDYSHYSDRRLQALLRQRCLPMRGKRSYLIHRLRISDNEFSVPKATGEYKTDLMYGFTEFQIDADLDDYPSMLVDSSAASGRNRLSRGFIKYCRLYAEQEGIRGRELERLNLEDALQKCPNIKTMEFGDSPRDGPLVVDIGKDLMGYCLDPSRWSVQKVSHPIPPPLPIFKAWATQPDITSLTISCSELGLLDGRFMEFLQLSRSEMRSLQAAFRSLKHLEIRLHGFNGIHDELDKAGDDFSSRLGKDACEDCALKRALAFRKRFRGGDMAQIVGAAVNLESLRLDFGVPEEYKPWRGKGQDLVVPLSWLMKKQVWKNLASLEIVGLGIDPREFADVVAPQKALKRIVLDNVGFTGFNEVNDGLEDIGWGTALTTLRRMHLDHFSIHEPWGRRHYNLLVMVRKSKSNRDVKWANVRDWCRRMENWVLHRE